MDEICAGVYQLSGFPHHMINMYLVDDVLVDAGIRSDQKRILKAIKHYPVTKHVLTHVHPDHQGASHAVCSARDIPLLCSEKEVQAMESGNLEGQIPENLITKFQHIFWTGAGHPVEKGLVEGDSAGSFTVIETPGHSPGHLSFWREKDRTLIVGDVARNINFMTLQEELAEPPAMFTIDEEMNRQSLRKLADLNPKTVLFGHGRPILDGMRFVDFALSVSES